MTQQNISFYISDNISSLSEKWIENTHYYKDVFAPHIILTQTRGMNNWLKMRRVNNLGNSTNLDFITPNDFLLLIYDLVHVRSVQKISGKNIDFLIFKILSEKDFQRKFPGIARYYINEDSTLQELRQWELAYQTADLLDQYQIYRQDILRRWISSEAEDERFQWQQYIWQQLHSILGNRMIDLSRMQTDVFRLLENKENIEKIIRKYPHISLFGISILSPYHIQMLYKLSEIIRIDFYLLNPAPEVFWDMDISESEILKKGIQNQYAVGHELLTNWGKLIQQTFRLLNKDDLIINTSVILDNPLTDNSTLLKSLKRSIHLNDTENQKWGLELVSDGSISIASHYTIQNEVTGLFNYIVDLTQKNSDIQDSDILIICTDINEYAPYIRSVFDASDIDIKYTITDENIRSGDNIISSLLDILHFDISRFSVDDIFKLLEHSSIRHKFNITRIQFLKDQIHNLNIKYGIHNKDEDDTYLVSWMHGMKKSILNTFLYGEEEYLSDNKIYALKDLIDQNEDILEINNLYSFIQQLMILSRKISHPQSISYWKAFIDETLQTFIHENSENFIDQYESIIQQLNQLEIIDELIEYKKISYKVFSHRLSIVLNHISSEGRFMKRGITFCSPIPFRSVPFRIIGFLGMNFDAFPRRHHENHINYITHHPQLGDRNTKDNDKHLFLESILSAEDRIYLSYIGKNTKDNTPIPPSILVDELLDYIQSQVDHELNVREILVKNYPLSNHSYKFNSSGSTLLPNYLIRKDNTYLSIFRSGKAPDEVNTLNWTDLINFYINPPRSYLTKHRAIYLESTNEAREDYEKTFLNRLETTIYKKQFVSFDQEDIDKTYRHLYYDGALPLKNISEYYLNEWTREMRPVAQNLSLYTLNKSKIVHSIECTISNIRVSASIETYGPYLIEYTTNSKDLNSKLRLYLNYILLRSRNTDCFPILITKEGVYTIIPPDKENVDEEIRNHLNFFIHNHKKGLPIDSKAEQKRLKETNIADFKKTLLSQYKMSFNEYLKHILDNYDINAVYEETMYLNEHIYLHIDSRYISIEN